MFRFSLQLLSEIFLILRRTKHGNIIKVLRSSCPPEVPVILSNFYESYNSLERYSKKSENTKFLVNPSSGSRIVRCGRTDRRDVANTLRKRISRQASYTRAAALAVTRET